MKTLRLLTSSYEEEFSGGGVVINLAISDNDVALLDEVKTYLYKEIQKLLEEKGVQDTSRSYFHQLKNDIKQAVSIQDLNNDEEVRSLLGEGLCFMGFAISDVKVV